MTDSQNPAVKLFRNLFTGSQAKAKTIRKYTGMRPSDVVAQGGQISEVVNRCLDPNDPLNFDEAFLNENRTNF